MNSLMMEPDSAGACAASLETLPTGRFLTPKEKTKKDERGLFKNNHAIGRSK